ARRDSRGRLSDWHRRAGARRGGGRVRGAGGRRCGGAAGDASARGRPGARCAGEDRAGVERGRTADHPRHRRPLRRSQGALYRNRRTRLLMAAKRYQAVKGTRDLLPPETALWAAVEATARRVFARYGFGEIRTPVFEDTELFARGVGESTDIVG